MATRTTIASVACCIFVLCNTGAAYPADLPTKTDTPSDKLALDFVVPDSPAFTVLDLTPDSVVRPKTPRQFATSLLSGIDRDGNFQSGLAVDVNPYLIAAGPSLTLADYNAHPDGFNIQRLLTRTQLSLGTSKGASSDDESVKIALGGSVTPYDAGDPRMDGELLDCIDRAQIAAIESLKADKTALLREIQTSTAKPEERNAIDTYVVGGPTSVFGSPDPRGTWQSLPPEIKEKLPPSIPGKVSALFVAQDAANTTKDVAVQACRDTSLDRNANASAWTISGAPRWESTSGSVNDVHFQGGGVWTSFALGKRSPSRRHESEGPLEWILDHSQLITMARLRFDTPVPDPNNDGQFIDQNDVLIGLRWRVGVERLRFSLEGAYLHEDPTGAPTQDLGRFAVSTEIKLAKDWWLQISGGGESGATVKNQDSAFVLSSLKFAFPSEPTIPDVSPQS